jgi:hypothetical protein
MSAKAKSIHSVLPASEILTKRSMARPNDFGNLKPKLKRIT